MMGSKRLSEIKRELRQALGNDKELAAWLDRQISHPSPKNGGVQTVEKDLMWVRELLREALVGKKPSHRKSTKAKVKREHAGR